MSEQVVVRGGMGLMGWLTLLFVGLKLTNFINWSWWWVLAPMWVPSTILLLVALALGVIWLILRATE